MKMNYVEPKEYFTPSARKILDEGETEKTVLFEHLSRCCMDFTNNDLEGFTILDDGSFYETKYKLKPNDYNLFSLVDRKSLDEKNCQKKLIFISKKLAVVINHFIETHKEEINALPKSVSNTFVLDGDEDLVRIGGKYIAGGNIFYEVPYKINEITFKDLDSEGQKNEKALELLTALYAEIKKVVDEEGGETFLSEK